jgi:hypothetical protein
MENEEERQEYVLNETGRIWIRRGRFGRPWNFGQARLILMIQSYQNTCILFFL